MSLIISASTIGISLIPGDNPLSVTTTGTIAGANAAGIYGPGVSSGPPVTWTIDNAGTISSTADAGVQLGTYTGLSLVSPGVVTNESTGVISGASGVYIVGSGSVTNQSGGLITGTTFAAVAVTGGSGGVINSGTLAGATYGVQEASGSTLTNLLGGTITGGGTTTGTIVGAGVSLSGDLINSGGIVGGAGLDMTAPHLYFAVGGNAANGVDLTTGTLTNTATGTIAGGRGGNSPDYAGDGGTGGAGVSLTNSTLTNAGRVTGGQGGTSGYNTGDQHQAGNGGSGGVGVILNQGGLLINNATITGGVGQIGDGGINFNNGPEGAGGNGGGGVDLVLGGTLINTAVIAGGQGGVAAAYDPIGIGGFGVLVGSSAWLNNSGTITGGAAGLNNGTAGAGVTLMGSGSLTNTGTIAGGNGVAGDGIFVASSGSVDNTSQGTVIGGNQGDGVYYSALNGTLTNAGTIMGGASGGGGVVLQQGGIVTNTGSISGVQGIEIHTGGAVTNQLGGVISGTTNGVYIAGGSGSVVNSGSLSGATDGVLENAGGSVANMATGVIESSGAGAIVISGGSGSVVNSGSLGGPGYGIKETAGGSVTNNALGYISVGTGAGIYISGSAGSVLNFGTILSQATGVYEANGGSVTNAAGGTISGAIGVNISNGTVVNDGTIVGTGAYAVLFNSGSPTTSRLIVDPSAVITGNIGGGTGVLELAAAANPGTLSGFGASITNFSSIVFDPNAYWMVGGNDAAGGLGTLSISGFAAGDTIDLAGFIATSETFASNTLTLNDGVDPSDTLSIIGTFSTGDFHISGDAAGTGTNISLGPPPPVITSSDLTDNPTPVIAGTAESGDTVTLVVGGATYTVVAAGGAWSIDLATAVPVSGSLALDVNGANSVSATATDPAGNVSTPAAETLVIDTTMPPPPATLALAPASDSGVLGDDITNVTTPAITGTGVNGDTVKLYDTNGTTLLGTATVSGGVWSITPATALSAGSHTLTATQTSSAGEVSAASAALPLVIDLTSPPAPAALTLAPASDSGVTGDDITNVTQPTITGTGTAGDTVTLFDGATAVGTGTVAADGTWSVITSSLAAGIHSLTAKQTSAAGNASAASSALVLTIDTTIPAAPVALTLAPASDSGTLGDDITSVARPTITGTGPANSTISLYDGAVLIGTATADGAGAWSIPATVALTEGVNSLTATATEVGGNVSPASAPLAVTLDTVAPTVPTLGESVASTNPAEPSIDGTADSGSLVTLYQNGTEIGSETAASGTWTYDYPTVLAAGTYTLNATATDAAGNVSALSANLILQVNADNSYAVIKPVPDSTDTKSFIYDAQGNLNTVQTQNAQQQVLTSVTDTSALINIYDTAGNLIGTITQPSTSAFSQPVFATSPDTLAASTGSGPIGSMVNLLSETNNFVSQGNDDITVHSGTAIITATGPSTVVNNISANVTFFGGPGTATVNGGSGSVIAVGGAGGGTLTGGTAGNNVLAAYGGVTNVVGVANGDQLFGANSGTSTLDAGAGVETLIAGAGTATLTANTGDTAFGGSGNSTLNAGANGGSTLVGGSGDNTLTAAAGPVSMWAGSGNSTLQGGSGTDILGGSTAIDSTTLMIGGSGDTTFLGSAGTTTATGGSGNDTYWTGTGAMTITEGSGRDTVVFGSGTATVTGGTGTDIYSFISGHAGGTDMINDFKVGVDQIDLFGYAEGAVRQQVSGGNTVFNLGDGTSITLVGVTKLAADSVRFG